MSEDIKDFLPWDSNDSEDIDQQSKPVSSDKVLLNYKFRDPYTREEIFGTMPIVEPTDFVLQPGETYKIPEGYHTGQGIIRAVAYSGYSDGTATEDDIMYNKIAWVNGNRLVGRRREQYFPDTGNALPNDILSKKTAFTKQGMIVGTMEINNTTIVSLGQNESYTIPQGYHSGKGTVIAKSVRESTIGDAKAEDIIAGKTAWVNGDKIIGVLKPLEEITRNLSVKPYQLLENITAMGLNGTEVRGTMKYIPEEIKELQSGETYVIPEGYHTGRGTVSSISLFRLTQASAKAEDIRSTKTAWVNGEKVTGTMIQYFAPNTEATAKSFDIRKGKTAWVNGEKVTGICPYNSIKWIMSDDNLNNINDNIAVKVPNQNWKEINLIMVSLYTTDKKLIETNVYHSYTSGSTISEPGKYNIVSTVGNNIVNINIFKTNVYASVVVSGFTLLDDTYNTLSFNFSSNSITENNITGQNNSLLLSIKNPSGASGFRSAQIKGLNGVISNSPPTLANSEGNTLYVVPKGNPIVSKED